MRRRRCILLALAPLLPATACSGQDEGLDPREAVERAYLAYWQAAVDANRTPAAEHRLADVATGRQLQADGALLEQRAAAGETVDGDYRHQVAVTAVDERSAAVSDCMTADLSVTGPQGAQPIPPGPYAVTATLVRSDGRWLVEQLEAGNQQCAAPVAAPSAGQQDGQ